ncbi:hypothetical protein BST61_g1629 [Cercospora zeina]
MEDHPARAVPAAQRVLCCSTTPSPKRIPRARKSLGTLPATRFPVQESARSCIAIGASVSEEPRSIERSAGVGNQQEQRLLYYDLKL